MLRFACQLLEYILYIVCHQLENWVWSHYMYSQSVYPLYKIYGIPFLLHTHTLVLLQFGPCAGNHVKRNSMNHLAESWIQNLWYIYYYVMHAYMNWGMCRFIGAVQMNLCLCWYSVLMCKRTHKYLNWFWFVVFLYFVLCNLLLMFAAFLPFFIAS